ncbi:HypC/HybG/HupF family hydrogenase formation chaperone [Candidatus Bipolaricaulota bacterium]|nr:HypC/HybG/HupF family hydrogenase formation chaperone [Candidatus Bipolaricaulota bacterium]HHR85683.1 HypC/HybG/HupF family hydrogenase formation chaperone [Candidatus Acetothermia bacterium]
MCVAIPALIRSIDNDVAQVEIGGITQQANLQLCPQAKIGDYVIVHTGYAINILDQEEAKETLELFESIARVAAEEEN